MTTAPMPTLGTGAQFRGLLTPTQFREAVRIDEVRQVRIATIDLQGRLRGKTFPTAGVVERLLDDTMHMEGCGYLLATDLGMVAAESWWRDGYPDVRLAPDARTARVVPWVPHTALVLADPLDATGQRLPVAPGTVLREQLAALAGQGLEIRVGLESEFVVYHASDEDQAAQQGARVRTLLPVTGPGRDYAFDLPEKVAQYLARLTSALEGAGLPVEAVKAEGAPGQLEVTFPYGDATAACEQHVLFKEAARALAARQHMAATFMAAPDDSTGAGLHLHLSLWREDRPVLAHPDRPEELSPLGQHVVAGLLGAFPDLMPLLAPYVNSYKRYRPYSFAPTRFAWGRDNRTCAVRVVGHGPGLHLEVRLPGADANPYLLVAAAAAAARWGIEEHLAPPAPVSGDAYRQTAAPCVPLSLGEAVDAFEHSALAVELFGEKVIAHYALAADAELRFHEQHVSDLEVQRGFDQA
ncbi:glutamine synthetase family protein [Kitasatospora sp. NBC_01287]|uniref:glutamine synthetase family protein n=1 Tax=Kitasatospora sp. NBC_01287 TaxID=2903573 RepID=UPI0022572F84|nr:glutamine synthetase family protein [Kitasatospora sp. NBC_01287]MCX4751163.1 glutamine synthetase family protein [Kitasatospora sp. NBC_01287]